MPTRIIIPRDGIATGAQQPRAVYDAMSHKVLEAIGPVTTSRASHVDMGRDLSQAALKVLTEQEPSYARRAGPQPGAPYEIRMTHADWWFADMTLIGHSIVLGPFSPAHRDAALACEVRWLQDHNIPTCQTCTEQPSPLL